jgi:hypothetical protein
MTPSQSAREAEGVAVSGVVSPIGPATPDTPFTVLDTRRMLTTKPTPIDWLIEGVVERGSLTLVAGREKQGKSLLCEALDESAGRPSMSDGDLQERLDRIAARTRSRGGVG